MERTEYKASFETSRSSIELLREIRDRKEETITPSLFEEDRYPCFTRVCAVVRSTHDDGGKERWERDSQRSSPIFASPSFLQPPSLFRPRFLSTLSLSSNYVLIGCDYDDNTSRRVG